MNINPHTLTAIAFGSSALALAFSFVCLALLVKTRREARNIIPLATQLESEMAELSRDLDTVSRRTAEKARRIAWLETRIRAAAIEDASLVNAAAPAGSKPTITERRHRVLSLARRGQSAGAIAATLGMTHGEVELLINLSQAA